MSLGSEQSLVGTLSFFEAPAWPFSGIDLTYWSWWEDGGVEGGEVSLTLGASFSAGTY